MKREALTPTDKKMTSFDYFDEAVDDSIGQEEPPAPTEPEPAETRDDTTENP